MIHLSLRQLEYFAAAAQHGGAARAAAALNVSQPSISKAIADLEASWGEPLFVRLHARGLALTAAGMQRHRQAQALLAQARALQGPRPAALQGLLRVGCLSTLAPRWLPGVLAQLRQSCPGIEVQLHEADTESLTQLIERGALDVALLYDLGLARPGVRLEHLGQLIPHALLPRGHRLAASASVRLSALAREPLILISLPHSRAYFLSLFRDAGVTPHIAFETPSLEMARALVGNGLGVSVLTTQPLHDRSQDGKRVVHRRLRGPLSPQPIALAYPAADSWRTPLAQPFAQAMHQAFHSPAGPRRTARAQPGSGAQGGRP